jgi:hypothetical protein
MIVRADFPAPLRLGTHVAQFRAPAVLRFTIGRGWL